MPSGFQQDSNQLQPAFYRVVIDMTNFYDNNSIYGGRVNPFAWDNFEGNALPSTLDNAIKLARGNLRWQRIVDELTKYNDGQIADLEVSVDGGAFDDADLVPTAIAFTIKYDRFGIENDSNNGDTLLETAEQQYLRAYWNSDNNDSEYDGEGINRADEAIQNMVMRALVGVRINTNNSNVQTYKRSVRVFVPVENTDPLEGSDSQQVVEIGDVTNDQDSLSWDNGNMRSAISVNLMDGTTIINQGDDNDAQTTTP